jgi:hypothetical protein
MRRTRPVGGREVAGEQQRADVVGAVVQNDAVLIAGRLGVGSTEHGARRRQVEDLRQTASCPVERLAVEVGAQHRAGQLGQQVGLTASLVGLDGSQA